MSDSLDYRDGYISDESKYSSPMSLDYDLTPSSTLSYPYHGSVAKRSGLICQYYYPMQPGYVEPFQGHGQHTPPLPTEHPNTHPHQSAVPSPASMILPFRNATSCYPSAIGPHAATILNADCRLSESVMHPRLEAQPVQPLTGPANSPWTNAFQAQLATQYLVQPHDGSHQSGISTTAASSQLADNSSLTCNVAGCRSTPFQTAQGLRRHQETVHSNARPFICGSISGVKSPHWGCSFRFKCVDAMTLHFKSHAGNVCLREAQNVVKDLHNVTERQLAKKCGPRRVE